MTLKCLNSRHIKNLMHKKRGGGSKTSRTNRLYHSQKCPSLVASSQFHRLVVICQQVARNLSNSSSCNKYVKADFHSVQNVAQSTFSERFLLNYKQSSGTNLISCG